VVDNSHAKGDWKYPVKDFQMVNGQTYFCRLKVDDMFPVKNCFPQIARTKEAVAWEAASFRFLIYIGSSKFKECAFFTYRQNAFV
jgi:hypothetical protein